MESASPVGRALSTEVSQSLGRAERIRKSWRFRWLLRHGTRYYSRHFTVVHRRSSDRSRLGLTVSRKVGNAVLRNRVKRMVRECFRRNKPSGRDARWLVVIAKPGAGALSLQQVCEELRGCLMISTTPKHQLRQRAPQGPGD